MSRVSRIGLQSESVVRSLQTFVATLLLMLLAASPGQAQARATLRSHTLALASVAYSPDGKYIATGSYDRTAKVWDACACRKLDSAILMVKAAKDRS
jgi:WD40 repeat protein